MDILYFPKVLPYGELPGTRLGLDRNLDTIVMFNYSLGRVEPTTGSKLSVVVFGAVMLSCWPIRYNI